MIVPVVDGRRGVTTIFDIPGDPPRKAAPAVSLKSYRGLPGGVSRFRYQVARRSGAERRSQQALLPLCATLAHGR